MHIFIILKNEFQIAYDDNLIRPHRHFFLLGRFRNNDFKLRAPANDLTVVLTAASARRTALPALGNCLLFQELSS